ncbi:MAG: hypothetical protein MUC88_13110 [Planctomycetes bacterium]|jgi:hypothetical protein|nr:hypothetical protein [Planctomycetota bacterium]
MRTHRILPALALVLLCNSIGLRAGEQKRAGDSILHQTFNLGAPRSAQAQSFEMETRVISYAPDGKRVNTDVLKLGLKCAPARGTGKDGDEYTCTKFTLQLAGGTEVAVPALANWTYVFKNTATGLDEKGQVFGIDHARFEKLVDANGQAIPTDKAYYVYNAFIDFHGFCNAFAEPTQGGKGIQDLTRLGQKIVHAAAFTEPPVNLGSGIEKGSTFKNGEVTLELKGLSVVDGAVCALVAFDSGQSSFQMLMKPMPSMEVRAVGASHYKGDIHLDLATRWVRKVTMDELVVAESAVSNMPNKFNTVIERNTLIRNLTPPTTE